MIKRICFFSGGFAFNRLVRMRYYEKIFPKDVEIFLFTTDKYETTKAKSFQDNWELERTKIHIDKYHPIKTPLALRKFCRKNKIERLVNLGAPGAGVLFIVATLFRKTDYLIGYYGEIVKHRKAKGIYQKIRKFFLLFQYILVARFAEKLAFTEHESYKIAPILFFSNKRKNFYLHASVDTKLFSKKNKLEARKKLNLPANKRIILRVGRINYLKCGDILIKLAENNPEIYFVMIGEWYEEQVTKTEASNVLHIKSKSNKELAEYYNAADLAFCLHRLGNSMGIVAEEALASGTPVLLPPISTKEETPAIIKIPNSVESVEQALKSFFSLSEKEREVISKKAREYAEKYCSDEVWRERYIEFHLK